MANEPYWVRYYHDEELSPEVSPMPHFPAAWQLSGRTINVHFPVEPVWSVKGGATMPEIGRTPDYSHRLNPDKTIDSVCLHCYKTVASSFAIEALAVHEARHNCSAASSCDASVTVINRFRRATRSGGR
jgi:hypothetical protein